MGCTALSGSLAEDGEHGGDALERGARLVETTRAFVAVSAE
jgi:hypothetical protein